MPQVSPRPLSKSISEKVTHIFLDTVVRIKNQSAAQIVMEEMLTPTERIMLSKRLAILYLLEKKYDYRSIAEVLHVSMGTINRMNNIRRSQNHGLRSIMRSLLTEEEIKQFFDRLDAAISAIIPPKGRPWRGSKRP